MSPGVVPDRYRIRVQWEWSPEGKAPITQWSTYELNGPLSNNTNAINQAMQLAQGSDYWVELTNTAPLAVYDYEIEQI